jgi:hypothetical protein
LKVSTFSHAKDDTVPQIVTQPDDVDDDDRLLTEKQSALFLGMGWPTWTKVRHEIPYIQVGQFKRHTKRILRRYQNSRLVKPRDAERARP